jgi:hypothetical protein
MGGYRSPGVTRHSHVCTPCIPSPGGYHSHFLIPTKLGIPLKVLCCSLGRPSQAPMVDFLGPQHTGLLFCPQDCRRETSATSWKQRSPACQLPLSEDNNPQQQPGAILPSASVSVLPSSSHRGVSCSGVGRKENTNAEVWNEFGECLF